MLKNRRGKRVEKKVGPVSKKQVLKEERDGERRMLRTKQRGRRGGGR